MKTGNAGVRTRVHQIAVLVAVTLSAQLAAAQSDTKGAQGSELVCRINVNAATAEQLQLLPRVGPVVAERIVAARPFASVDDLRRVRGIGEKTLDNLRPLVSVEGRTETSGCALKKSHRQPRAQEQGG